MKICGRKLGSPREVETRWFRERKPEDMYRSDQCTYPCGRSGLGQVASPVMYQCTLKLELGGTCLAGTGHSIHQ